MEFRRQTFMNQFKLIITYSESGKSYLINQLILGVQLFCQNLFLYDKAKYKNKCLKF